MLAIDMTEGGDDLIGTIDLLGFAKKDINLRLSAMSCTLVLRKERQRPSKIDKKVLLPLPVKEEEEKVVGKETYENGVITLKIPTSSKSTIITIT
jgi:HSP20 family molecular chaperone IbpA